ncbi:delta-lactam-biosynthetic de-N-acetylase [Cohnella lubricantis]|uniref:Delta-lactam-biosynthetic de-N-acetylase n=1 Tax=Cohnella lubricantis TaxID=2163172 RepID=A0A841TFI6_9BACL|nr:delta-lactam-biosynthetic de-N-acetylase [Cohnella lubricantis]MBB6678048.1 delta-lactam-biosynthetic de-N-acetylase [Cohnella lubricantis]MBP2120025.1 peptidoglycan-N-acetylmuramic acid deacetylase [Cohnella lubricantis]
MRRNAAVVLAVAIFACMLWTVMPSTANGSGGPYHFGFKKSKGGQLPSIAEEGFMPILRKHGAIFLGNTEKKELYLTFDNGYENGYTGQILDVLKEKKVPAIFFVTGHYVKDQPDLLVRMAAEGHLIGNHSWSHPDLTQEPPARVKEELEKVSREVARITGQGAMQFVRPPRGIFSDRLLGVCRGLGYTNVFWSIAYRDWETNRQMGWNYAYTSVVDQLHPGAVILLHAVSRDNAEALGRIIDEARARGYEFKRIDSLQVKGYR